MFIIVLHHFLFNHLLLCKLHFVVLKPFFQSSHPFRHKLSAFPTMTLPNQDIPINWAFGNQIESSKFVIL